MELRGEGEGLGLWSTTTKRNHLRCYRLGVEQWEGLGSQAVALHCGPEESGQEGQWGMGKDEVQEFGGMWLG